MRFSLVLLAVIFLFHGCKRSNSEIYIDHEPGLNYLTQFELERGRGLSGQIYFLKNHATYISAREITDEEHEVVTPYGSESIAPGAEVYKVKGINKLGNLHGLGNAVHYDNKPFGYAIALDFISEGDPRIRVFGQICMGSEASTIRFYEEIMGRIWVKPN